MGRAADIMIERGLTCSPSRIRHLLPFQTRSYVGPLPSPSLRSDQISLAQLNRLANSAHLMRAASLYREPTYLPTQTLGQIWYSITWYNTIQVRLLSS